MKQLTNSKETAINGGRTRGPVIPQSETRKQHNATSNGRNAIHNQIATYIHDLRPVNNWEKLLVHELATIQWEMDRHLSLHTPTPGRGRNQGGSIHGITTRNRSTRAAGPLLGWMQSLESFGSELTHLQTARRKVLNTLTAHHRGGRAFQTTNPLSVREQSHQPTTTPPTRNPAHPANPLSLSEQSHQPNTPPPTRNPAHPSSSPAQPTNPPSLSEQTHQPTTPAPTRNPARPTNPLSLSEQTHRKPAPSPPRRST